MKIMKHLNEWCMKMQATKENGKNEENTEEIIMRKQKL